MTKWLVTILAALFLCGCATKSQISDSSNLKDGLQRETEVTEAAEDAEQVEEDEALVIVNGEVITINDYSEKLKRLSNYERARYRGEEGHQEFLKSMILQLRV